MAEIEQQGASAARGMTQDRVAMSSRRKIRHWKVFKDRVVDEENNVRREMSDGR
jgi:hypothetical protein